MKKITIFDDVCTAKMLAEFLHNGQTYGDGEDYTTHLQTVHNVLIEFKCYDNNIIIGAWLHDAVEDTVASFKLIKKYFGDKVERVVYLVTNETGVNRKERNLKTYQKLKGQEDGLTLKLADRIANTRKAIGNEKFFSMYKEEYVMFRYFLYDANHSEIIQNMWKELDKLYSFV